MSLDSQTILKRRRFEELMQAGRVAYKQGDRKLAHDHWREAALLDPYNEKVWLALYRVLDLRKDRIVCLENIIAINPLNVEARRRLQTLQQVEAEVAAVTTMAPEQKPAPAPQPVVKTAKPKRKPKPARRQRRPSTTVYARPRRQIRDFVAIVVVAVLIGLMAALVAVVLLTVASREAF